MKQLLAEENPNSKKERVIKMIRKEVIKLLILGIVVVVIAGCMSNGPIGADGIPAKKYLVGGGFAIEWVAPTNGTAYLVEERGKKIIQTKSLVEGDKFDVSIDPTIAAAAQWDEILGTRILAAKLLLYFVPAKEKDIDREEVLKRQATKEVK